MTTQTTTYTVRMHCEGDGDETVAITAVTLADARKQASRKTSEWVRGGEWGIDGARVSGWWEMLDEEGERLLDDDGAEIMGDVTVEIEPAHESKIIEACGGKHSGAWERCCGGDPDDHDWTSEGEGGCTENPGVWSTGGTSMSFAAHCKTCGLHRSEHHTGSQRNPGEHDTVSYEMPETWCDECERGESICEDE